MRVHAWLFNIMSAIASTFAIVSLIQSVFNAGLTEVFGDLLDYYRQIVQPIHAVITTAIQAVLAWESVPNWATDLLVLSALGASSAVRISMKRTEAVNRRYEIWMLVKLWVFSTFTGYGLYVVLMGLFAAPFIVASLFSDKMIDKSDADEALVILTGLGGALLFFALAMLSAPT